ncbi:PP2C family protein-serine/threonine phosphatase [Treponema zioleckii]|uniref:PP2C family protein-serine/threonine phosphatase n=1 Tax=Treponema zioleckii TaxID=331680 RepID=UPI00168BA0BD|nr:PP2C family protein-serine/threonine phosphatase [Treponema zioleckii]
MIYGVLNLAMGCFLIWLSYYTDHRTGDQNTNNPLVTMNSILAAAAFVMAVATWSAATAPERFTYFLGQLALLLSGAYAIEFCNYCIFFPKYERPVISLIINWILFAGCGWIVFTQFTAVNITPFLGLRVDAKSLFTGKLTNNFPYSWYELYYVLLTFILPALSVIIMLLRSENRESRLDHQKTVINSISLIVAWIWLNLLTRAMGRVPMFSTLFITAFALAQVIMTHSLLQNYLYDVVSLAGIVLKSICGYFFPALFVGFCFPRLWKIYPTDPNKFYLYIFFIITIAVTASYYIMKFLRRYTGFKGTQYSDKFEEGLANVDFGESPDLIVKKIHDVFINNIGMSFFRVLIENGNNELESIYDEANVSKLTVKINNKLFDSLLNQNSQIVFKTAVENGYHYEAMRKDLLDFFSTTKSDAVIILNEGRHILGVIILGQKAAGNIYTDYDMKVFENLYSYFFVFGYYMKNIGNQSIVGTVNREIHMSEQIIESIQGNMDPIKNKRYDTGNIMIHAHNIGGEFIDLIRLSDDRHVFVMGDLSGKGISASMSMVIVKSVIRTYLAETKDFKLLVEKVNKFIRFNLPKEIFFEGVFGLIDFNENTVYYINAGVPAMFLYNRSYNNIIEVQGEGHVLGFVKDISPYIKVKKIKMNPGDILVTCTDGLIDTHSLRGEQFGKDRIQKVITENTSLPASKLPEVTYSALVDFVSKELEDDVSIFVLKCLR